MLAISILLSALCWTVRPTTAATGRVFINGAASEHVPSSGSLSPIQARLVLAQRAGVEDFHKADLKVDGVIQAINDYGRRQSLFEPSQQEWKAFLLMEGLTEPQIELPQLDRYRSFAVDDAPGASATRGLWTDFGRQALPSVYSAEMSDGEVIESMQDIQCIGQHDFFYIGKSVPDIRRVLDYLASIDKHAVTIYASPPGQYSKSGNWDSDASSWGTYEMPGSQSPLRKRAPRTPQVEEPLELAEEPAVHYNSTQQTSSSDIDSTVAFSPAASGSPLPGILPACFPSLSQCQSSTRNCTGHGSCRLAYTDQSAASQSPFKSCYSCACSATKQTVNGRTSTTYWAGPACQKKDVSVEFWMIALFTAGMVGLIGFAVGSVWSMGDEELPSVIGAGVSGPVKRP